MYDSRYSEEQEAKYQVALKYLRIDPEAVILDVGCGTGLLFSHLQNRAKIVLGVDISKQLLIQAKDRAKMCENIFLIQADADHLPFTSYFFDLVFAFTMLQNMPKPSETLKEMLRVAKQGSSIVVTGLKRVISLENLGKMLKESGFSPSILRDDQLLNCHIAVSKKS